MRDFEVKGVSNSRECARDEFISFLQNAINKGDLHHAENLANKWLFHFPGDLEIQRFTARIKILSSKFDSAKKILKTLISKDVEYLEAYKEMLMVVPEDEKTFYQQLINTLSDEPEDASFESTWVFQARRLLKRKLGGEGFDGLADNIIDLPNADNNALVALIQFLLLKSTGADEYALLKMLESFHKKWPDCLQFKLYLAELFFQFGENVRALQLLHECSIDDICGQVPHRLWGSSYRYINLWLQNSDLVLKGEIQIQKENHETITAQKESFQRIENEKDEISKKVLQASDQQEIRFSKSIQEFSPVYVILSSKQKLIAKFGEKTFSVIDSYLRLLRDAVRKRPAWKSVIFYPDDEKSCMLLGMEKTDEVNPWALKRAIVDLDAKFQQKKKMVAALLIIGGHSIIPFHELPNPTDDHDNEVLSDNPYATSDNNYFIPEWPVGRLVNEKGPDPGLLLRQLREMVDWHSRLYKNPSFFESLIENLKFWEKIPAYFASIFDKTKNFGYTTAVWRRASLSAYRPIGSGNTLRVSPPFATNTLDLENISDARYGYFNLHGLAESPSWYGQKDFSENSDGPDFPIAISADQLVPELEYPQLVCAEACYGAYAIEKSENESLVLRFISLGTRAFVGSTCISYGSVFPPLISADLLASIFWKNINEGFPVGESLLRAKLSLVQSMVQKQGYLDGEDQKTLLSFVLYGDPLLCVEQKVANAKIHPRVLHKTTVNAFADDEFIIKEPPRLSGDTISNVKEILREYLPGVETADFVSKHQELKFYEASNDVKGFGQKRQRILYSYLLTYKKNITIASKNQIQYARVTLDENGKMLKLALSK